MEIKVNKSQVKDDSTECQFKRVHKETCKEEWFVTTDISTDSNSEVKIIEGEWTNDPDCADIFDCRSQMLQMISDLEQSDDYFYYVDYIPELI